MKNSTYPKWIMLLFAVSLLLGFGKNYEARKVYRDRDKIQASITQLITEIQTVISARVTVAKQTHPKYTAGISTYSLVASLEQATEKIEAADGPNPQPVAEAISEARTTLAHVQKDISGLTERLNTLDTALKAYPNVASQINGYSRRTNDRIAEHIASGYFDRHFNDARLIIGQLSETEAKVTELMQAIDPRDNRPDYVLIYAIGRETESVATQSLELADRAPKLRQTVSELVSSTGSTLGALHQSFSVAYDAAERIERYSAYRRKGFSDGLRTNQQRLANLGKNLDEISRLNSMELQEFARADTLLHSVRSEQAKLQSFIDSVSDFDVRVRGAVANLRPARAQANSSINRAQSHIDEWKGRNDQGSAISILRAARRHRDSARQYEATDPMMSVSDYQTATRLADNAYNQVDTYVPPPPSISFSDDDDFGSSSSNSFGGFGGSSGGGSGSSYGGGSSGGGMGGSYGGPGSGSFGGGN